MVQPRTHVREFHEIAEILDRCVTPALVQVAYERRTVRRYEYRPLTANNNATLRISGVLHEFGRRGVLHDRPAQPTRKAYPLAIDIGAGIAEEGKRLRKITEFNADFLENRVGILLDELQAFLVQHLEIGNPAIDERSCPGIGTLTCRNFGAATARLPVT